MDIARIIMRGRAEAVAAFNSSRVVDAAVSSLSDPSIKKMAEVTARAMQRWWRLQEWALEYAEEVEGQELDVVTAQGALAVCSLLRSPDRFRKLETRAHARLAQKSSGTIAKPLGEDAFAERLFKDVWKLLYVWEKEEFEELLSQKDPRYFPKRVHEDWLKIQRDENRQAPLPPAEDLPELVAYQPEIISPAESEWADAALEGALTKKQKAALLAWLTHKILDDSGTNEEFTAEEDFSTSTLYRAFTIVENDPELKSAFIIAMKEMIQTHFS